MDKLLEKLLGENAGKWERIIIIAIAIVATPGGLGILSSAFAEQQVTVDKLANIEASRSVMIVDIETVTKQAQANQTELIVIQAEAQAIQLNQMRIEKHLDEQRGLLNQILMQVR